MEGSTVMVIGSGGREHCLAWKLTQSDQVAEVILCSESAGPARQALSDKCKIQNLPSDDFGILSEWCRDNTVDMVVIGPEVLLANGIVENLNKNGVKCFGPQSPAAEIESNKAFAKSFMTRNDIPTAKYEVFTEAKAACDHICSANYPAFVVKASGLAAGKGVIVAQNKEEACSAVHEIANMFSQPGIQILVEELLEGEEFSVLCFTDGKSIQMMPPAQDHKRLENNDKGPNTGGMGAYCPCPQISDEILEYVSKNILQKAVDCMREEGRPYVGVLYAGIMLTSSGPKVLEFNCRFGDPECQVILPLLESDLYTVLEACIEGRLSGVELKWKQNLYSLAVVMASSGYPGPYEKGKEVKGIIKANATPHLEVFEAGVTLNAEGKAVTSGGRVLSVAAVSDQLTTCLGLALAGVHLIQFEGAVYRTDIAARGIEYLNEANSKPALTYAQSGVDVAKGDALVESIKSVVGKTARPGSSPDLRGFGGLFDLAAAGYKDPVLVSGTDGVGTKLLLAQSCNLHATIGQDLVAMCVNDILTHNAEPLFFLDYFACGKLAPDVAAEVVAGIAEACRSAGCALIGGETAEMPGMYQPKHYDLAGFAVGALERGRDHALPLVDQVADGDVIIGLASTGVHSNGFSLIRKVVERVGLDWNDPAPFDPDKTLGQALLTPTAIYSRALLPVIRSCAGVKCAAHITGGGLTGNLPRVLPPNLRAEMNSYKWEIPEVFKWIAHEGNVSAAEMMSTFNCGLGMCLVVAPESSDEVLNKCQSSLSVLGLRATIVGNVTPRKHFGESPQVVVRYIREALRWKEKGIDKVESHAMTNGGTHRKRAAVLISGSGTNLQALIDHASAPTAQYRIELVISNRQQAKGVQRAEQAGIRTLVVDHSQFSSREDFDAALDEHLIKARVEIVCLAGFMRLLSGWFVKKWAGKLLNIHPSLLPSFKGADAQKQVLQSGVLITGCTVHFVTEKMDDGAILAQESVPVFPDDTVDSLRERVKKVEHKIYPVALDKLASGRATFNAAKNRVIWRHGN